MKGDLLVSIIKFHITDVMAWLDLPDWNNEVSSYARYSLAELRRLLKISQEDITRRMDHYGVPEDQR